MVQTPVPPNKWNELRLPHPLHSGKSYPARVVLRDLAAQEGCDGEPYDTMVALADLLDKIPPPAGCSCHPDDRPQPCPRRHALSECIAAAAEARRVPSFQVDTALRTWEQYGGPLMLSGQEGSWHVSDRIRMMRVIQALACAHEMPESSSPGSADQGDPLGTGPGEAGQHPRASASPEPAEILRAALEAIAARREREFVGDQHVPPGGGPGQVERSWEERPTEVARTAQKALDEYAVAVGGGDV